MYKREFDNLLKKGLPKAVLLYGEEYFVSFYMGFYKQKLNSEDGVLGLYYDEYNFQEAKSYLAQSSLFGGVNLLVIRRSKPIPKKELDILVELSSKNPTNYLLLLFDGEAKDAKKMHKSFEKSGVWVRFFPPNQKESYQIIFQKIQELKLAIEQDAIYFLMESFENNIPLILKELEKLAIVNRPISKKDIEIFTSSISSSTIDSLIVELFQKKDIIKTLSNLLELGSSEADILRSIQIFMNQIFLFHSYIKAYGTAPSSQEVLGYRLPKPLEQQRVSLAMRLESKILVKVYQHLLDSEIKLKKSNPQSRESLLFGILIKLQRLL
jgi:DNA polymerase-3 subunit delta